jgi:hypothetical protein
MTLLLGEYLRGDPRLGDSVHGCHLGTIETSPDACKLGGAEVHVKAVLLKYFSWDVDKNWDVEVAEPTHPQEVLFHNPVKELRGEVLAGIAEQKEFFVQESGFAWRNIDDEERVKLNPLVLCYVNDPI